MHRGSSYVNLNNPLLNQTLILTLICETRDIKLYHIPGETSLIRRPIKIVIKIVICIETIETQSFVRAARSLWRNRDEIHLRIRINIISSGKPSLIISILKHLTTPHKTNYI